MRSFDPANEAEFDRHAESYDEDHRQSIRASGEEPDYFARYKADVLARIAPSPPGPVLDFGCGIGNLTSHLADAFGEVHGFDPSARSVAMARERTPRATFSSELAEVPARRFGLVVIANVLHHVPVADRPALLEAARDRLVPGGTLAVFEHNPLNPLTRRVVAACKFDEDAVLLYPWETKRRLREAGLAGVTLDYIVFFPRALAKLRPLEPRLAWLGLGAQVCAWGTRR